MSVSFIIAIRGEGSTQTGAFDCELCAQRMQIMKKKKKNYTAQDGLQGNWDADIGRHTVIVSLCLSFCETRRHIFINSLCCGAGGVYSLSHSTWSRIRWWRHWAALVPARRAEHCAAELAPLSPRSLEMGLKERKPERYWVLVNLYTFN